MELVDFKVLDKNSFDEILNNNLNKNLKLNIIELKTMEECSELTSAIAKCVQEYNNETRNHLIEEMADVINVLCQIKNFYDITNEELENYLNFKIKRTKLKQKKG